MAVSRIKELDALRGIAAISVLLFHYTTRYQELFNQQVSSYLSFPQGKYGVHLFFIISGFVILMTLEKTKRPMDFVINRFARLFPTYWIAVILTFLAITIFPLQGIGTNLKNALINLTMLQYFLNVPDVDGAYWSLAFELVFYGLIFSLFLIKKINSVEKIGFIWLVLMIVFNFAIIPHRWFFRTFLLLRYANLFYAGMIFYHLKTRGDTFFRHCAIGLCLITQFIVSPLDEALMVTIFMGIFYLFVFNKLNFLNQKWLLFLGAISYPLYLTHEYIGYIFIREISKIFSNGLIVLTSSIIFAILLATALHYLIEDPARKLIKKFSHYS